jgi:RNA polymerase sigma factor (sigma-70 family)
MLKTNPQDPQARVLMGRLCLKIAEGKARSKEYHKTGIDCDAVVSETCQKMLKKLDRGCDFETEGHFLSYLFNILRNSYNDAWRKAMANYNSPNWLNAGIEKILDYPSDNDSQDGFDPELIIEASKALARMSAKSRLTATDGRRIETNKVLARRRDRLEDTLECLAEYLKPDRFEIFLDRTVGGMSSKEVARKYGISQNMVDQICSRARKHINLSENHLNHAA